MNPKVMIGGLIITVALIWGGYAFISTTVPYVAISKAEVASHQVSVMGKIDFDRVSYDSEKSLLQFAIYDLEAEDEATAHRMPVIYSGVTPGNFDQATSVVIEGKSDGNGTFVASNILVKCPSKYQGEGGEEYQDMEIHNEAVEESSEA